MYNKDNMSVPVIIILTCLGIGIEITKYYKISCYNLTNVEKFVNINKKDIPYNY